MKHKTGFKNFGNIGYQPMNGRYISITFQKNISVDLYCLLFYIFTYTFFHISLCIAHFFNCAFRHFD